MAGWFSVRGLPKRTGYGTLWMRGGEGQVTTLTASRARAQLYRLLDKAAASHEPVQIAGRRHSAVLISEEDWRAIQETLYLVSIPGMRESIRRGLKTRLSQCRETLRW